MRNKCNIVRDLLPLYVENMASDDTMSFVSAHLRSCSSCSAEYENMTRSLTSETFSVKQEGKMGLKKVAKDINNRIKIACMIPMMFILVFGLGLTVGFEPIANFVIMPLVGVLGYFAFRWRSVYILPLIVLAGFGAMNLFHWAMGSDYHEATNFFAWYGIYCVFIMVGILIAGLLHFAFKKEK